jgi:PSP1 C-terminal conserved region
MSGLNTSSILLEKNRLRGSTPDSEALASSDDEVDHANQQNNAPSHLLRKDSTIRRPSWASDMGIRQQRTGSFSGQPLSPSTSHPSTPSGDATSWAAGIASTSGAPFGRGITPQSSFPWGTGIWNPDSRKEPPARLSEVLPSPTSTNPHGKPQFFGGNGMVGAPLHDQAQDSNLPFAIPLHPTPKTYRSQSYSVGQMDLELNGMPNPNNPYVNRARPGQQTGLHHRPSRPSMLSEVSNDGTGLGQLHEVDDDDESTVSASQNQGIRLPSVEAQALDHRSLENALLKQATSAQLENTRVRGRTASTTSIGSSNGVIGGGGGGGMNGLNSGLGSRFGFRIPEDSEYAIDEAEDGTDPRGMGSSGQSVARRYSEIGGGQEARLATSGGLNNRQVDSVKKAHWQSSLGWGAVESQDPQSRRHSFAELPPRFGSISSASDVTNKFGGNELSLGLSSRLDGSRNGGDLSRFAQNDHGMLPTFSQCFASLLRASGLDGSFSTPAGSNSNIILASTGQAQVGQGQRTEEQSKLTYASQGRYDQIRFDSGSHTFSHEFLTSVVPTASIYEFGRGRADTTRWMTPIPRRDVILEQKYNENRAYAASYFSNTDPAMRLASGEFSPTAVGHPAGRQNYLMGQHSRGLQTASPPGAHSQFGIPPHMSILRPHQLLYIVTFKASRADVFYIQEGTGLSVKPGDLVIVEADRGTDLGTVVQADVTWDEAKNWKDHYASEHYRWLMVFSRHNQAGGAVGAGIAQTGLQAGSMLANQSNPLGVPGSAVGGMGPVSPQNAMQDPNPGEIKPKMIKRLAQNHEIQTLRDKEGNEAKAKRVCQQKVVEHRLTMEILDAEFQM